MRRVFEEATGQTSHTSFKKSNLKIHRRLNLRFKENTKVNVLKCASLESAYSYFL